MTDPLAPPPWLHLLSAFRAMEPADTLISFAKLCGGGWITEKVQRFIWKHCINETVGISHAPYLKSFLKKLINELESSCGDVLDELYEQYAEFMTSMKDDQLVKARVCKYITFLFPDGCFDLPSCPKSRKLRVQLQCSLNMLEGDTGCSIWPSSLFLSEFILSFPHIFSNKSCFEVGSGVGLVGICLAYVKASKLMQVILTDGDPSTLANMRYNLELNKLSTTETDVPESEDPDVVKCIYLPWESASENEIRHHMPEIILGADVIYNPECLPHLVRVLAILLNQRKSISQSHMEISKGSCNGTNEGLLTYVHDSDKSDSNGYRINARKEAHNAVSRDPPVAYIASVIRNIDTFNYFLELAEQASLTIKDVSETQRPFNLLPYMQSYERSSIRLFTVSSK